MKTTLVVEIELDEVGEKLIEKNFGVPRTGHEVLVQRRNHDPEWYWEWCGVVTEVEFHNEQDRHLAESPQCPDCKGIGRVPVDVQKHYWEHLETLMPTCPKCNGSGKVL